MPSHKKDNAIERVRNTVVKAPLRLATGVAKNRFKGLVPAGKSAAYGAAGTGIGSIIAALTHGSLLIGPGLGMLCAALYVIFVMPRQPQNLEQCIDECARLYALGKVSEREFATLRKQCMSRHAV
jgi:hypothetical protein